MEGVGRVVPLDCAGLVLDLQPVPLVPQLVLLLAAVGGLVCVRAAPASGVLMRARVVDAGFELNAEGSLHYLLKRLAVRTIEQVSLPLLLLSLRARLRTINGSLH